MSVKDPLIYVAHILDEISVIEGIINRLTQREFSNDPIAYRAAVYSIQTISEASRALPVEWQNEYPDLPWHAIRAVGNKIRHEYFRLDDVILWNIINVELGPLKEAMLDLKLRKTSK